MNPHCHLVHKAQAAAEPRHPPDSLPTRDGAGGGAPGIRQPPLPVRLRRLRIVGGRGLRGGGEGRRAEEADRKTTTGEGYRAANKSDEIKKICAILFLQ